MDIAITSRGARVALAALLAVVAVLVGVSFVVHARPYLLDSVLSPVLSLAEGGTEGVTWLGVDQEQSIPAWFSSSLMLLCALLLFSVASRTWGTRFGLHWAVLAVIFVLLSIDEAVSFHERAIVPIRGALGAEGLLYYAWVIPGAALVILLAIFYARFMLALPRRTGVLVLISAVLFVGGAIGMETLGANHAEDAGQLNLAYVSFSTLEELFEMLGLVVFVYALITFRVDEKVDRDRPSVRAR